MQTIDEKEKQSTILQSVYESIEAVKTLEQPESLQFIEQVAIKIANCLVNGNKVMIAGNGGSLCDAMHFAEELTGFFRKKRKALPALCLSDPAHMSCVSNDEGFNSVYARMVDAFGKEGDILILLTTSGNSENLIQAQIAAKQKQVQTIAFLGKTGGKLMGECDLEWIVKGFKTSDRIQEAHMAALHIIIEHVEYQLDL